MAEPGINNEQEALRQALTLAADEIFDLIGQTSIKNYFSQSGDRPVPLKVTSRSGSLMQAVLGGVGGIRTIEFLGDTTEMKYGIGSPQSKYAILLHEGGIRAVTEPMRRFFFMKMIRTADAAERKMWANLRFKDRIVYKPRPFIEKAIQDAMPMIEKILEKYIGQALEFSISKTVTGNQKAISPQYAGRV